MPPSIQDFDIAGLSLDERTLLAHQLRESVQHEVEATPLTADQLAEIERRIAETDAGRMASAPWKEVKRRLRHRE